MRLLSAWSWLLVGEKPGGGCTRAVKEAVEALRIAVDACELDPSSSESDLELLELRGAVVLLLDPVSRAPLEVPGRVPVPGVVRVRPNEIQLTRERPGRRS